MVEKPPSPRKPAAKQQLIMDAEEQVRKLPSAQGTVATHSRPLEWKEISQENWGSIVVITDHAQGAKNGAQTELR